MKELKDLVLVGLVYSILLNSTELPIKKTLNHPKACEERQHQFELALQVYQSNNRNLVYIDETGFDSHNFRLRGYASRGKKCFAKGSWGKSKRTNAIGALFNGSLFAMGLFNCAVDSECFYAWATQILIPKLPKNSVLIMDNASFHKRNDILQAIQKAEHEILWLPPYSPEYNPIEKTWAWLKKLRMSWKLDCISSLVNRFIDKYSTFS